VASDRNLAALVPGVRHPGHAGHCRAVLYFLGNHGLTLVAPTLWVMHPFTTGSEPRQPYPNGIAPSGCCH